MEELLQYLNAINPLSDALINYLSKNLKTKNLRKKDFLLKIGHVSRDICFINKGLLRCFYLVNDKEVCSWFMKEADVIISVESFFRQTVSKEAIQAIENCKLYYISYEELQSVYRDFPEFNFTGRVLTERYYTLSEQRLYALRMHTSKEKYLYLREYHPELILRVPNKDIASYLGITEGTLSRLKASL